MEFVYPVATFILAAVLKDAEYLMSARTLEKSRLLMVPAELIRSMMDRDAAFARSIVHELSCRYRAVVKNLKDHKLRSEEHTSELQSLMRISYAVLCLKKN